MITAARAREILRCAKLSLEHIHGVDREIEKALAAGQTEARYNMPCEDQDSIAEALAVRYRAAGWLVAVKSSEGSPLRGRPDRCSIVLTLPGEPTSAKERG